MTPEDLKNHWIKQLLIICENRGLNHRQIAEIINEKECNLSRYINSNQKPTIHKFFFWCKQLNICPQDITNIPIQLKINKIHPNDSVQNANGSAQNASDSAQNATVSVQNPTVSTQNATVSIQNASVSIQNATDSVPNPTVSTQNSTVSVQNHTGSTQNPNASKENYNTKPKTVNPKH